MNFYIFHILYWVIILKKKWIAIIIGFLIFFGLILLFYFFVTSKKVQSGLADDYPQIILTGEKKITIALNHPFVDPGYQAVDKDDGDLTNIVIVKNNVDYKKVGTYQITYYVKNSKGNTKEEIREVIVEDRYAHEYKDTYDTIDNTKLAWWLKNNDTHTRPVGGNDAGVLKQYDAYYIGPDEKIIYLTFDEGSNDTYVKEILDVLNQNEVKATFFFCKGYMTRNPELMKELVKSGMSVGNHTANHMDMTNLANKEKYEEYLRQVIANEEAFYEITGVEMDRVYREPKGEYSLRSLQMVSDLGYKSYFWSASHYDFAEDVSKDVAYAKMLQRYHNGAIYLLHPKNKGNYLALDDYIKKMKSLGYQFGLVRDI